MFSSIKGKLIAWLFLIFSLLFAAVAIYLHHEIKEIITGAVDDHLYKEVQLLKDLIDEDDEISEAERGEHSLPLSGHYYQLSSPDGKIIARSPSLAIVDATLPLGKVDGRPHFTEITGPGKDRLRVLSQHFTTDKGAVVIQAAETLEEPYELIGEFRETLFILFPISFIISIAGIVIITGSALSRLDRFSENVEQITEKHLDRRLEEAGLELELLPLATAFNDMMNRLEQSFKRQGQFLSDASHDLRTPTSVIKSHCDIILKKKREPEAYIEALQKISMSSERMANIISRILEVARLDNKGFCLARSDFDVLALLGDAVKMLEPKVKSKDITITVHGESISISADREKVFEAVTDLIENAIKYNKRGGAVNVALKRNEKELNITVSDTGIGIAENEQEKIFDRFYRTDTSRGITEGTGLGLSIVKAIIDAHGGRIELKSSPGEGSSFTFTLPLSS
ncbi:MAG: sensor histidine kinase N-terminal domain-containing protein [Proteobacteria bacterium]|nr:sensor histidine kinase N-terminal domain-containing protein [Pseudomonadota bacterium]